MKRLLSNYNAETGQFVLPDALPKYSGEHISDYVQVANVNNYLRHGFKEFDMRLTTRRFVNHYNRVGGGRRAPKLNAVTGAIGAIVSQVPSLEGKVNNIVAAEKPLIGATVTTFNTLGWHSSVATQAAAFAANVAPLINQHSQDQAQAVVDNLNAVTGTQQQDSMGQHY